MFIPWTQRVYKFEWHFIPCSYVPSPKLLPPASEGWGKVIVSVCLFVHTWGVPGPGQDGRYPSQVRMGGTLARDGVTAVQRWGTPRIGQEMEYLMRGRWYASCIVAGLSCFVLKNRIAMPIDIHTSCCSFFQRGVSKHHTTSC